MKYTEAVQEVLNHNNCEFLDLLIGLHCRDCKRKIGFYGRLNLAWKILKGEWTIGVLSMPSGETIGKAMLYAAENIDKGKL